MKDLKEVFGQEIADILKQFYSLDSYTDSKADDFVKIIK